MFTPFFRALKEHDITKLHIQLCTSLIAMLVVFLIGIDRTENEVACTFMSCVILYFALSSVFWMGAEVLIMYMKFINTMGTLSTLSIILVSIICWGESQLFVIAG